MHYASLPLFTSPALKLSPEQLRLCKALVEYTAKLASVPGLDVQPMSVQAQVLECFDGWQSVALSQLQRLYETFTVFLEEPSDCRGMVVCTLLREYGFDIDELTAQELYLLGFAKLSFPWFLRFFTWILEKRPICNEHRRTVHYM